MGQEDHLRTGCRHRKEERGEEGAWLKTVLERCTYHFHLQPIGRNLVTWLCLATVKLENVVYILGVCEPIQKNPITEEGGKSDYWGQVVHSAKRGRKSWKNEDEKKG